MENLSSIAEFVKEFDIVGLQELDGGSLRSGFVNHAEYLAEKAGFPYWYNSTNRKIGNISHHSLGILSKIGLIDVETHKLPGRVPGRGVLVVKLGRHDNPLVIIIAHLSLGKYSRMLQIDFISNLAHAFKNVILMGDLNCSSESNEISMLIKKTGLKPPVQKLYTFPSWRPTRKFDHILVSPHIHVKGVRVPKYNLSDHLPIAMDIIWPDNAEVVV
jgi:endonuclease/exonuclease/phosphatase family metal-dependent hydrolase